MKKIIICIATILATYCSNIAQTPNIQNFPLDSECRFIDMDMQGSRIVILGDNEKLSTTFDVPSVFYFDGNLWHNLPINIASQGTDTNLLINNRSCVAFDMDGNIWVSGKSLYKYSNNSWTEYYIEDSLREIRSYGQLVVDNNNKVWCGMAVMDNTNKIFGSELLVMDNDSFQKLLESNSSDAFWKRGYGRTFLKSPEGNIIIHRSIYNVDPDYDKYNKKDLYIYSDDMTYKNYKILNIDTNTIEANVCPHFIYPETEDKIWIGFNTIKTYIDNVYEVCCSGLSLLNNGEWIFITEENGLPLYNDETDFNVPVQMLYRVNPYAYWVFTAAEFFLMDNDYKLYRGNFGEILGQSIFLKSFNSMTESEVNDNLQYFYDTDSMLYRMPVINKILQYTDGSLWILMQQGILKVPASVISDVSDDIDNDKELNIYPNPADDYVTISNDDRIIKADIIDLFGRVVLNFDLVSKTLFIGNLSSGVYFLRLTDSNNSVKYLQFTKY